VQDLDRQVLTLLAEDLLLLLLQDLSGPVMRVDDLITDLVLDLLRLPRDLEVLDGLLPVCCRNGVLRSYALRDEVMSAGTCPPG
jgi:hypothetical protein